MNCAKLSENKGYEPPNCEEGAKPPEAIGLKAFRRNHLQRKLPTRSQQAYQVCFQSLTVKKGPISAKSVRNGLPSRIDGQLYGAGGQLPVTSAPRTLASGSRIANRKSFPALGVGNLGNVRAAMNSDLGGPSQEIPATSKHRRATNITPLRMDEEGRFDESARAAWDPVTKLGDPGIRRLTSIFGGR